MILKKEQGAAVSFLEDESLLSLLMNIIFPITAWQMKILVLY